MWKHIIADLWAVSEFGRLILSLGYRFWVLEGAGRLVLKGELKFLDFKGVEIWNVGVLKKLYTIEMPHPPGCYLTKFDKNHIYPPFRTVRFVQPLYIMYSPFMLFVLYSVYTFCTVRFVQSIFSRFLAVLTVIYNNIIYFYWFIIKWLFIGVFFAYYIYLLLFFYVVALQKKFFEKN